MHAEERIFLRPTAGLNILLGVFKIVRGVKSIFRKRKNICKHFKTSCRKPRMFEYPPLIDCTALIHCHGLADESKSDSSQGLLQDYVLRQLLGARRKNDASMRNKKDVSPVQLP